MSLLNKVLYFRPLENNALLTIGLFVYFLSQYLMLTIEQNFTDRNIQVKLKLTLETALHIFTSKQKDCSNLLLPLRRTTITSKDLSISF